jgi:hypothetical protein
MYSRIKDGVENLIDVGILKEAHEAFHHKSTGLCVSQLGNIPARSNYQYRGCSPHQPFRLYWLLLCIGGTRSIFKLSATSHK